MWLDVVSSSRKKYVQKKAISYVAFRFFPLNTTLTCSKLYLLWVWKAVCLARLSDTSENPLNTMTFYCLWVLTVHHFCFAWNPLILVPLVSFHHSHGKYLYIVVSISQVLTDLFLHKSGKTRLMETTIYRYFPWDMVREEKLWKVNVP